MRRCVKRWLLEIGLSTLIAVLIAVCVWLSPCEVLGSTCADAMKVNVDDDRDDKYVRIDVSSDGVPWLVWQGVDPAEGDIVVCFSRYVSGAWEAPARVHSDNQVDDTIPEVSIDSDDVPWVVWKSGYDFRNWDLLASRWSGVGEFAEPPGQHGQPPGACGEKEELGPVYMYGELVEKPYVFTNVGGDTLYLNGVPYWPIREPAPRRKPMSEEQLRRLKELREGTETHAFADSVGKLVRAMHDSGATYEECLDAYAEMYGASPLVRSVSKGDHSITITWANGTEEVGLLDFQPAPPLPTKEEIHKDLMEKFWREVGAGNMIAKGYAGGLTYTIYSPRPDIAKMNRLINRLAAGDTLSAEDVMGTPLADELFRMDVSRRVSGMKPKEE